MRGHTLLGAATATVIAIGSATPSSAVELIALTPLGTYSTGLGEGSAEIVALDGDRAFAERVGGVLTYDITNPLAPVFESWANNRTYAGDDVTGDSGPEGLVFAPAESSPTGAPLLLVGNEVSGTVTACG